MGTLRTGERVCGTGAPRQNLSSRPVASSTTREPQPSCPSTPQLLLGQHEVQDQPKPGPPPASRLPNPYAHELPIPCELTLTALWYFQCDETHPTCNNCKKSKRECLGYDPIFKQQQTPSALQPAPSGGPSPSASAISPAAPSAPSGTPAPYTTHPTPVLTPSDPPATRESSDDSATVKNEPFEPARPPVDIDPALDKTAPSAFAASAAVPAVLTAAPSPTTDFTVLQPGEAPHLRGGRSPFSATSAPQQAHTLTQAAQ